VNAHGFASCEESPSRIVKLVVGAPAGGGIDIVARLIEPVMSQSLGQKIIVDNRPGANQSIGAGFVAHSPPDGYTMLISTSGPVTNALSAPVSYDPATAFQSISRVMTSPFFLVVPEKSKLKTVGDLIAAGKDPSQVIRYGHPGPGTATHLATALLNKVAGTNFVGIPYRGSAGQIQDTISGELQFGLLAAPDALSRRNDGLRILGVSGATRSVLAPSKACQDTMLHFGMVCLRLRRPLVRLLNGFGRPWGRRKRTRATVRASWRSGWSRSSTLPRSFPPSSKLSRKRTLR